MRFKKNDARIEEVQQAIEDLDYAIPHGADYGNAFREWTKLDQDFHQLYPEYDPLYPEEWKRSPKELAQAVDQAIRDLRVLQVNPGQNEEVSTQWVQVLFNFNREIEGRPDLSEVQRKKLQDKISKLQQTYIDKFPLPWEGGPEYGEQPRLA